MIKEIIVVEGKDDIAAVKKAVDCTCLSTHGYGFNREFLDLLKSLDARQGIIVFTDPDYAGNNIRRKIKDHVPGAKHAYLSQKKAWKNGDIGIENAKPEDIRKALAQAKAEEIEEIELFDMNTMMDYGLVGQLDSKQRRILLGEELSIGYGNAKRMLEKLNSYNIARQEFIEAMRIIDEKR